uniref:G_PROTEIN_RECEP_F1_2 domain-containing protein n=1 Tax=Steinernema glaseri TaxID=37863 RepID=A0A1I7XYC9_9BILA
MPMEKAFGDYGVVLVLRFIIFLVATVGNGFIIFLILRCKKLRNERGIEWRFTCLAVESLIIYGDFVTQNSMYLIALDRLNVVSKLHRIDPKVGEILNGDLSQDSSKRATCTTRRLPGHICFGD